MHEHQLRWSINLLLFCLFFTKPRQVPKKHSSIAGRRRDDIDLLSAEFSLGDIVIVLFQTTDLLTKVARVPKSNSLVLAASNQQVLVEWRVVDAPYFSYVSFYSLCCGLAPFVPKSQSFVIAHTRKLIHVDLVPGNVFYFLRVPFPYAHRINR